MAVGIGIDGVGSCVASGVDVNTVSAFVTGVGGMRVGVGSSPAEHAFKPAATTNRSAKQRMALNDFILNLEINTADEGVGGLLMANTPSSQTDIAVADIYDKSSSSSSPRITGAYLEELQGKSVRCGLLQAIEVLLHRRGGWGVVFAGADVFVEDFLFDVGFDAFVFFDPLDGFFGEP